MRKEVDQARISTLSKRLKTIEKARKELTRQLEELELEAIAKRSELASLRNEGAPISSLPDEVLAIIFEIGQQIPRGYSNYKVWQPFELAITHVTRHWRFLALGTPQLWTKVMRSQFQQRFNSISAYLRRSEPLPFDLDIHIGGSSELDSEEDSNENSIAEQEMEDIDPFFHLIKPHLERCKHLFIDSEEHSEGVAFLRLLSSVRASSLRSMDVSFGDGLRGDPLRVFQGGAPKLAHLELTGISFGSCRLPTTSLTVLRLDRLSWPRRLGEFETLGTALSAMHLLSHLKIEASGAEDCWPAHITITLPALRSLVYLAKRSSALHTSALLLALDVPMLEEVSLEELTDDGELENALAGRFPNVTRLCLSSGFERAGAWNMRMLALAFPATTTLAHSLRAIYRRAETLSDFFESLARIDTVMWPKLGTLQIPLSEASVLPIDDLAQALIRRAAMGAPIATITLPKSHLEQGLVLAACTEPPVQILQYADDTPSYFPQR